MMARESSRCAGTEGALVCASQNTFTTALDDSGEALALLARQRRCEGEGRFVGRFSADFINSFIPEPPASP